MPRAANPELPRRLLEAALVLLDERGDTDFGLREVAARTGYTVTAVYRCFGSRAGLLDALRARLTAGLGLTIGVQDGPIGESLRELAFRFVSWSLDHPARFRLLFGAAPAKATPPTRAAIVAIEIALSRAAQGGEIRTRELHLAARSFLAAVVGLAALALAGDAVVRGPGRWTDPYLAPTLEGLLGF